MFRNAFGSKRMATELLDEKILETPIEYLKGVGPQKAEILKKDLRIATFGDLLHYFPFRYVDKSAFIPIGQIPLDSDKILTQGRIVSVREEGSGRGKRLKAVLGDETGQLELIWFKGINWVKKLVQPGKRFTVYGKISVYHGHMNISHPDLEAITSENIIPENLQPVYHSGEMLTYKGLNSKGFERLQRELNNNLIGKNIETLSPQILQKYNLPTKGEAIQWIHFPDNNQQVERATFLLKFEELFFLQMEMLMQKAVLERKIKGQIFGKIGQYFNSFYNDHLPFELTGAQKRVLKEVRKDVISGKQMNRLIQGDVGSGKTIVALLAVLMAIDNGFQGLIMAPTEILAGQHYETFHGMTQEMGIHVVLLTGSTKTARRREIHAGLLDGTVNIIVGTHALLEDPVQFQNLGMAVIDEQHRFGVAQRAKLWRKNTVPPHMLVMTATPIPRTLAMTLYGDLDVSVIDELPPGRKPVQTSHEFEGARLKIFGFLQEQINLGRQVYMVYPLIEESETLEYKNLMEGYESITRRFPQPDYQVSIVHGRMKPADKEFEMQRFIKKETQIMVATTVIEVGVNVPNASIMVIENAERFGLSQLHQLRGRVGRGGYQSYCVLMTDVKISKESKFRLETMVRTNDGFEIAEADLKLRGPGDLLGTQQSGILDLKIADVAKDVQILSAARQEAIQILRSDPGLKEAHNYPVRVKLKSILKGKPNWGRIS